MTREERLAVRELNEQTKLTATATNAVSIAILGAAIIVPGVNNPAVLLTLQSLALLLTALALHMLARSVLLFLRE